MSLKFYLGGSGHGKSYKLHRDIIEWAAKEPDRNFLFLVPDQYTMQTQMDLVKASPSGGIMNIDVLSFSRLAHRVFEELGLGDSVVLDDTGKSLILRRLGGELKDSLPVLGANMDRIGYIHEIKSVISEFKTYSIDEGKIDEMIELSKGKGLLKQKLLDLKCIYSKFNDYICNEYITSEETMTLLEEVSERSNVIKNSVMVFDGFTGFTPIQYRLIGRFLELTKQVIVSVTIDIDEKPFGNINEQELFGLSKNTIKKLQLLAQEKNVSEAEHVLLNNACRFKNSSELAFLEKNIFRYSGQVYKEEPKDIFVSEVMTPDAEVELVCRQIYDLVMEKGYEYRNIAVVCGKLGDYSDSFLKYAKVFNLPVYIDETKGLRLNPFVEYIRSALLVINDNFSYQSVFHLLRSGMCDVLAEDIDLLENYVLKLGIKGKKKYLEAFTRLPYRKSKSDEITKEDMDALLRLNETRAYLIGLLRPLLEKRKTARELIEGLYEFIEASSSEEKLERIAMEFENKGNLDLAGEYRQIYRVIIDLLDQMYALLADSDMKMDEFIKTLDSGIEELTIGTIPKGVDRIIVGDIERTRIGENKVLFLLGANDGNIPGNNSKGGLISDIDREFLKESSIELSPTPREQIFIQRLYLYLCMTRPAEKLYVSYSLLGNDAKTRRPSYLIGMLEKMYSELKIKKADDTESGILGAKSPENGIDLFGRYIGEYAAGRLNDVQEEELYALFAALNERVNGKLLEKLLEGAFYEYKKHALSKDLAESIYGSVIDLSVSRLEKYASCAYKHFLTYGIGLSEREEFGLEKNDIGNIYHNILNSLEEHLKEKGYSLSNCPNNEIDDILDFLIENESVLYGGAILRSSSYYAGMIKQIKRILKRTVDTIRTQLEYGRFDIEDTEMPFREEIKIDESHSIRIKGRIDRVDTYVKGDKLYVKITDYKSSSRDIELDSLLYGLSLQQPVYMKAAMERLAKKYPALNPQMAAMLYYTIADPLVKYDGENDEDINEKIIKELRPKGLVSELDDVLEALDENLGPVSQTSLVAPYGRDKDGNLNRYSKTMTPDLYETISDFTMKKISDMGSQIMNGNIGITPVIHGGTDACQYCSFKEICPYDEKLSGYKKKQLKKLNDEQAIEEMKQWT